MNSAEYYLALAVHLMGTIYQIMLQQECTPVGCIPPVVSDRDPPRHRPTSPSWTDPPTRTEDPLLVNRQT